MKQRVPVSQIMATDVVTLNQKNSLYDAERLFRTHNIRHLPVVDGKTLVGVLSFSDLLKISYADVTEGDEDLESVVYDTHTILQVMAKVPTTVSPDTTIKEVVEVLSKHSFHSLPVTENGQLKGIVTTTDLLKYFLEQY